MKKTDFFYIMISAKGLEISYRNTQVKQGLLSQVGLMAAENTITTKNYPEREQMKSHSMLCRCEKDRSSSWNGKVKPLGSTP
jgi:hypothetical protein